LRLFIRFLCYLLCVFLGGELDQFVARCTEGAEPVKDRHRDPVIVLGRPAVIRLPKRK